MPFFRGPVIPDRRRTKQKTPQGVFFSARAKERGKCNQAQRAVTVHFPWTSCMVTPSTTGEPGQYEKFSHNKRFMMVKIVYFFSIFANVFVHLFKGLKEKPYAIFWGSGYI